MKITVSEENHLCVVFWRHFICGVSQVLQKFGKTDETKDEEFSFYVQDLNDQQVSQAMNRNILSHAFLIFSSER